MGSSSSIPDMETLKSHCKRIWDEVCNFTKSVWEWTKEKVTQFWQWLSMSFKDLNGKIKNVRKNPALNSENKAFLDKMSRNTQELNNDLLEFQKLCNKVAESGTDEEKTKVANQMKDICEPLHHFASG